MIKILKKGELKTNCKSCKCEFTFGTEDAFSRGVPVSWNGGSFDREIYIFVRCPQCSKRVDVTNKVSASAVKDNDDPLCKCKGGYCNCYKEDDVD